MMKINRLLIVIIIILSPLNSMAENENLELYEGKWIEQCKDGQKENEKNCALERSLFVDKEMKKKLITIVMQTNSLTKEVRFILISPLGTLIQSGVKIGFDGNLINQNGFGFNICQQYGCITTLKMTENILNNFKKAKNLNLEYLNAQGRKIDIDFGLKGFTEQYKKISVN